MNTTNLRQRQSALHANKNLHSIREPVQTKEINKFANADTVLQNATSSLTHRLWTRAVVVLSVMTIVYFYAGKNTRETKFALVRENLPLRVQKFKCSEQYQKQIEAFPQCAPKKCGRFVTDKLIDVKNVEILLDMMQNMLTLVNSSGAVSIVDIHSGSLSNGENYFNIYKNVEAMQFLKPKQLILYRSVNNKIKLAIAEQFGIDPTYLHLAYPTFFSQIKNATSEKIHHEYWQEHIYFGTNSSVHYNALLYLTTLGKDFEGGRFIFLHGSGKNRKASAIEPKKGRVIAFTSGHENPHYVENVTEGSSFDLLISFTCDKGARISDVGTGVLQE